MSCCGIIIISMSDPGRILFFMEEERNADEVLTLSQWLKENQFL